MADRLEEALKHSYIYVPRGTQKDTLGPGKRLGLTLARERRAPLTVLSVQKTSRTARRSAANGEPRRGGMPRFATWSSSWRIRPTPGPTCRICLVRSRRILTTRSRIRRA